MSYNRASVELCYVACAGSGQCCESSNVVMWYLCFRTKEDGLNVKKIEKKNKKKSRKDFSAACWKKMPICYHSPGTAMTCLCG